MKTMDKNGKIAGKISIIDLFVLLVIAVLIAGSIYRFTARAAQVDPGEARIEYVLRVAQARELAIKYYQDSIGLPAFDRVTGLHIGDITNVRHEARYPHMTLPDGSVVAVRHPGTAAIYIYITATGRATDSAIYVGGTREINVGGTVFMRSKYVDVETVVNSINVVR